MRMCNECNESCLLYISFYVKTNILSFQFSYVTDSYGIRPINYIWFQSSLRHLVFSSCLLPMVSMAMMDLGINLWAQNMQVCNFGSPDNLFNICKSKYQLDCYLCILEHFKNRYQVFMPCHKKWWGYYVIPSEILNVHLSVHPSISTLIICVCFITQMPS